MVLVLLYCRGHVRSGDRPSSPYVVHRQRLLLTPHSLVQVMYNNILVLLFCNDPSAGSPTETLLRLLLPLNDPAWTSFRLRPKEQCKPRPDPRGVSRDRSKGASPMPSLGHSIGSSDGRCVQRAGTKSVQSGELRLLGIPRSWGTISNPSPL